jgi:plastocyanin
MGARLLPALIYAAVLAVPTAATAAGTAHAVRIEGMKFVPERIDVQPGDTITWTNVDIVPHTVTGVGPALESGSIPPKGKWIHRARSKGVIEYICRFHPTMKGKLEVR